MVKGLLFDIRVLQRELVTHSYVAKQKYVIRYVYVCERSFGKEGIR